MVHDALLVLITIYSCKNGIRQTGTFQLCLRLFGFVRLFLFFFLKMIKDPTYTGILSTIN